MDSINEQFPILESYTYLNTASCGLYSKKVNNWRIEHSTNLHQNASLFRDQHKVHVNSIRETVASFFGAITHEVALVPNFSWAYNAILDGLPFVKKVAVLENDYPSLIWPLQQRNIELCTIPLNDQVEEAIERILDQEKPDMFVFSKVQYINGIAIDDSILKRIKAYHPNVIFMADGTQFLGTSQFNFNESPIDILGASCYKWLLSGYGNGVFLLKDSIQERLNLKTIGFNSADAVFKNKSSISSVAQLEPGHLDTFNFGTLQTSLLQMKAWGVATIEKRIMDVSSYAFNAFKTHNLLDPSTANRTTHSTIFNIKGDEKQFEILQKGKIIGSLRGNGIRLSFHFYNSKSDVDKVLEVLQV